MALPKKKPPADALALLIPEEEAPSAEMPDEEDLGDDTEFEDDDLPEEEPLAAESDDPFADEASVIDPEQAALCERLGFSEPDQQQAFIDLVKLINSADSMGSTDSGASLPPLPESAY